MRVLRVLLLGCVLMLALAASAGAQDGRSYHVAEVDISAELHTDGTLSVVEDRTFAYRGTYRGAFYELPLQDGQVVRGVTLTDGGGHVYTPGTCSADGEQQPGTYEVASTSGSFSVTWCYPEPVTDAEATTRLAYEVSGAGTRHEDASQLYWQWIGEGWDVPTDALTATVRLPTAAVENPDQVLIWAHGPLQGEVDQPEPGLVRAAVTGLPPSTFVEVRVLMPPDVLADVESDGNAVREDILAKERCLAVAADAERARARGEEPAEDCDPDGWRAWIGNPLLVLGLLAGGGTWWTLFRRHGKEHDLPAELADYERELPSDHPPALVGWLQSWGSVADSALVATIMDLAERGHIELSRETHTTDRLLLPDKEQEVIVLRERSRPAAAWERDVHELLFDRVGRHGPITDADLKKWVEDNRDDAYEWWQKWTGKVEKEAARLHWIDPMGTVAASIALGLALIGLAVAAALWLRGSWMLAAPTLAVGVWALAASPLMRRRTKEGRVLHHRWARFGAYLRDFSLIEDKTPDYLRMWGRFIVYAVPLGVADQVMRNLDASLSLAEKEVVAGGWYPMGGFSHGSFSSTMASLSAGIPSATIASSPSSSGSGGGFSGGGGGGGGGSGGGSF